MAQVKGGLLYIDRYMVFDIEDGRGNTLFEWFDSFPDSTRLDVNATATSITVKANGETIGTTSREPGFSNVHQCINDGWQVFALKRDAVQESVQQTRTEIDFERRDITWNEVRCRGYVSFIGIDPNATDEEKNLLETYLDARSAGIKCPSLTTKAFESFAAKYKKSGIASAAIPEKLKRAEQPKSAVDQQQKKPTKEVAKSDAKFAIGGCLMVIALIVIALFVLRACISGVLG